jgi:N-acetylglutamate synthase-like GNAT family acetyltransferase
MTNKKPVNEKVESCSNEEVLVRTYAPSDHDHVRNLFVEGMRINNAPESYIERSLNTDLANIEETYMKDRGTFLVMERVSDSAIVGTVGLEDLGDLCELRRMSIHASERRKGLGRTLVEHFIAHARQHKFDGIKLSTGSWMESAMKFYSSLGFEDKGRVTYKTDESCGVVIANFEMLF